jgi:translation initiation factor 2 subunit 1
MKSWSFSELTKRKVRLVAVNHNIGDCILMHFAGYIDLSKRRVSAEDMVKCEERYNKSKSVHSILRHVAEKTNTPLETLYQHIGWPLNKKYGHANDAFKLSIA